MAENQAPEKKKKPGRPEAEIDKAQFEKLCAMQCTEEEICGFFGITDKTLVKWIHKTYGNKYNFSDIFKIKRADGKISLRRSQFKLAERDSRMAIWLGKQYLDQHEPIPKQEQEEIPDDGFMQALEGEAEKLWPKE